MKKVTLLTVAGLALLVAGIFVGQYLGVLAEDPEKERSDNHKAGIELDIDVENWTKEEAFFKHPAEWVVITGTANEGGGGVSFGDPRIGDKVLAAYHWSSQPGFFHPTYKFLSASLTQEDYLDINGSRSFIYKVHNTDNENTLQEGYMLLIPEYIPKEWNLEDGRRIEIYVSGEYENSREVLDAIIESIESDQANHQKTNFNELSTYRNEEYGYSFKYPKESWDIIEGAIEETVILSPAENNGLSREARDVVRIVYRTDLETVGDIYENVGIFRGLPGSIKMDSTSALEEETKIIFKISVKDDSYEFGETYVWEHTRNNLAEINNRGVFVIILNNGLGKPIRNDLIPLFELVSETFEITNLE